MKTAIFVAAALFAAPAFAQTTTTTTTTDTTGSITFTPAQETTIRQYVVKEKTSPVTVKERVTVGATLPADVELQTLPSDVVTDIPSVRSYRYVSTDAGIAIVEPSSRKVVRVIQSQ
ncbi:MAG TPA: DUF1236 domain-containing protein [Microvirga sp.]|jgi:serine protease inhibitor ecotin